MAVDGETRVIGPWDKMKSSFGGMLLGLVLLPGAFVITCIASKREQASEVFKGALPAAEANKAAAASKAVYATGTLDSEMIGDPQFVKPGRYLSLSRSAEMYAWEQKKETKKEKDGNTTIEKDVYDCKLTWTSKPDTNVGSKKGCEGKSNPSPTTSSASFTPGRITIASAGATYPVNPTKLDAVGLPGVKLTKNELTADLSEYSGSFYFKASCATSSPAAGCERVSFSGTTYKEGETYTVIGALPSGQFEEYSTGKTGMLAGSWLKVGPGSFEGTMKAISSADSKWTMGWFLGSVVCFWLGLTMLTGPILQLIEFIPLIGGFGKGLIQVVFGVFSFVIMGLSFIIIEYFWLILLLVVAIAGFLIYKKKSSPATA